MREPETYRGIELSVCCLVHLMPCIGGAARIAPALIEINLAGSHFGLTTPSEI
jgi:hypothetical protein